MSTKNKGWALCILFNEGLSLKIYKDSKIRKFKTFLHEPKMEKLSRETGESQAEACSSMLL